MALEYEQVPDGDLQPYAKINDNNESLGQAWTFARIVADSSGLVIRIGGGPYKLADVAGADLTCVNGANYIVAARSNGALSVATATTNWTDTVTYGRVGQATFTAGVLTGYFDSRHEPGGIFDSAAASGGGDVDGPASAADNDIARFDGTTGKLLKAGLSHDNDAALAANSATRVPTQAAVKGYVDGKVAGLSWKQAVRAATTANLVLATDVESGDVIDGVTLATGDRVLLKNQSAGSENGIYTVNATGAPTRATDADSGAELVNASLYVSEGTANADSAWVCTTNAPITLGTTVLVFAQFNGGGGITALTGDVTASGPGSAAATIANNAITNAKAADVATQTIKGRTTAGTGDPEDLTPAQARAVMQVGQTVLAIACSDETTALTTGTNKVKFINPFATAFNITAVVASLSTAQTSGAIFTVDVNEAGASILSTKLTIDNTETNSSTAATPPVVSDASIAAYAEIAVDIDQVGDGTAKGLKVYLIGYPS